MGEYEDRYPDSYGHGEETDPDTAERHFSGVGLPRQVRDDPATVAPPRAPPAERAYRPAYRAVHPIARSPRQICDDVYERLNESPFIDATEVTVTVTEATVTLDGTINSLIAVSLARALALNTAGVSDVQLRLKVRPAPRAYETVASTEA